jgi:NAD(P)-dependent dehydrogenase (short-subunit alcohol dehydrogenase family)
VTIAAGVGDFFRCSMRLGFSVAKDHIRVNTLSLGAIETNRLVFRCGNMEAARKALVPLHPIGRLGRPDEIANGALFLASDESSFMN